MTIYNSHCKLTPMDMRKSKGIQIANRRDNNESNKFNSNNDGNYNNGRYTRDSDELDHNNQAAAEATSDSGNSKGNKYSCNDKHIEWRSNNQNNHEAVGDWGCSKGNNGEWVNDNEGRNESGNNNEVAYSNEGNQDVDECYHNNDGKNECDNNKITRELVFVNSGQGDWSIKILDNWRYNSGSNEWVYGNQYDGKAVNDWGNKGNNYEWNQKNECRNDVNYMNDPENKCDHNNECPMENQSYNDWNSSNENNDNWIDSVKENDGMRSGSNDNNDSISQIQCDNNWDPNNTDHEDFDFNNGINNMEIFCNNNPNEINFKRYPDEVVPEDEWSYMQLRDIKYITGKDGWGYPNKSEAHLYYKNLLQFSDDNNAMNEDNDEDTDSWGFETETNDYYWNYGTVDEDSWSYECINNFEEINNHINEKNWVSIDEGYDKMITEDNVKEFWDSSDEDCTHSNDNKPEGNSDKEFTCEWDTKNRYDQAVAPSNGFRRVHLGDLVYENGTFNEEQNHNQECNASDFLRSLENSFSGVTEHADKENIQITDICFYEVLTQFCEWQAANELNAVEAFVEENIDMDNCINSFDEPSVPRD